MLRLPFSQESISIDKWDVIVIGAGAAGLMTCLELPENLNVLLLNRNTSKRSSSRWAQGGIASVVRPEDSFALHVEDTLKAGDDLCDVSAVEMLVKEAPGCVDRLQNLGMIFDQSSDQKSYLNFVTYQRSQEPLSQAFQRQISHTNHLQLLRCLQHEEQKNLQV